MPDSLLVLAILSALVAVWAYYKARRLHVRIERTWPGFNAYMREHVKGRTHGG